MRIRTVFAVGAVILGVSAGQAFAESEGNGDPFAFQAAGQASTGRAFVSDTGSAAYPELAGNSAQPSSLAQLDPGESSEAQFQTANSAPLGFAGGSLTVTQAQDASRYLASQALKSSYRTAVPSRPKN